MPSPKSILFISSRAEIAGGEKYLLDVTARMDRLRYRPIVVLPGDGAMRPALEKAAVESFIVPADYGWFQQPFHWYRYLRELDGRVRQIADVIKAKDISLVHTNSNLRLEGAFAAQLTGTPHVYGAHAEFETGQSIYERVPMNQATFAQMMGALSSKVVAVSQSRAAALVPPLAPDQVSVVHNGLDAAIFDGAVACANSDVRRELGIADDVVLVTAVGRIEPIKGHDYLVQAAARVCEQAKNVRFLLVGSEEDKTFAARVRGAVADSGLADSFTFLGFRSDVPHILSQSDLFVLSSRSEGHPLVLLEAMAAGCAVVATRCGGAEDTVVDGVSGRLVDVGNVDGMARAIIDLANDKERRSAMGAAARQHVRQNFTLEKSVDSLMAVYDEVLATVAVKTPSLIAEVHLRTLHEMGDLGLRLLEMEERLRKVENFTESFTANSLYKFGRQLKHWLHVRAN